VQLEKIFLYIKNRRHNLWKAWEVFEKHFFSGNNIFDNQKSLRYKLKYLNKSFFTTVHKKMNPEEEVMWI
jgi:hypothetical protein